MQTRHPPHRRAAALLLAAAALPFIPAYAQEAQPPVVEEPILDSAPPPVPQPVETPAPTPVPAPVVTSPPPVVASPPADPPVAATQAQQPAPARTTRAAQRPAPRAQAPTRRAAPAPAAPAPAATAAPVGAEVPAPAAPAAEAVPPPVALPAEPAAAPPSAPQPEQGGGSMLPWLIAGLLALGALAFFLLRRRRREDVDDRSAAYAAEPVHEPAGVREPQPAAGFATAGATAVAAGAAPVEAGRPELDLDLRPRRAGVTGDEAVVEFELSVDNHGSAAAKDVRVSTWMFPAGSQSEMERALIEHPEGDSVAAIEAGAVQYLDRSVTLPTSSVSGDSVLPVVVAEARYRLPDGSEARTSASYAVGVPDGEELAYFAIDNPSGLHDEVIARPMGETGRA